MTDHVTETFRCTEELSKQLSLLAELSGCEGKSEYIRHLITSDLQKQMKKAALYQRLEGVSGNNNE